MADESAEIGGKEVKFQRFLLGDISLLFLC